MRLAPVVRTAAVNVGQLNVWNLFDTVNDPRTGDTVYTAVQYAARLHKIAGLVSGAMEAPDVLTLQEIENETVLRDLLATPELAPFGYKFVLGAHSDSRGIRNAILYRGDRIRLDSSAEPNPKVGVVPEDPDGDAATLLFARAPIVATFTRVGASGLGQARDGAQFTIIANHFKSKLGGDVHEPRRQAQGAFVGGLVDAQRGAHPNVPVIVLGDLNATPVDGAYHKLVAGADGAKRVIDVTERLAAADRYSFIYRGKPDLLDHFMVTHDLADAVHGVRILHVNSGTPSGKRFDPSTTVGTSDHDPVLATINLAQAR